MKKSRLFKMPLWQQVVLAAVLGIIAGIIFGKSAENFKFLGAIFINLIRMVIVPLIVFSIVAAIISMESSGSATKLSLKSILSFLATSVGAVVLGITTSLLVSPGRNTELPVMDIVETPKKLDIAEFLLGLIPDNAVGAMASGHVIQVMVFSIVLGIAVLSIKDKVPAVCKMFNEGALVTFKMIEMVVKIAPIGVFGYISWSVGTQGADVLISLAKLVGMVMTVCFMQLMLYATYIIIFARINPLIFFKKMVEPMVMALSTSSSKAALTTTMRVMHDRLGVSMTATNFVLPIGTSINMNGGAIYLSTTALFFAHSYGVDLNVYNIAMLAFTCTIGSIGAAGIPSGILLFLGLSFDVLGLPVELVALVAGVDRVLDMVTTVVNVTGDACITLIVDKTEGSLDLERYNNMAI